MIEKITSTFWLIKTQLQWWLPTFFHHAACDKNKNLSARFFFLINRDFICIDWMDKSVIQ